MMGLFSYNPIPLIITFLNNNILENKLLLRYNGANKNGGILMDSTNVNLSKSRLDLQRISEISGALPNGRPKAHVFLRYYLLFSNGAEQVLDSAEITKPSVFVSKHAGYVDVRMDFGSARDQDLNYIWKILEEYSLNSVSYTQEEIDKGFYFDGNKEQMVYYPTIDIALSPIGKETEYQMIAYNPIFYTLEPRNPESPPSILHFVFDEDFFVIVDDLNVDEEELQKEIDKEDSEQNT